MKSALIILMFAAVAVNIYLLYYLFSRRDRGRSVYFSILSAALIFYSIGYILELSSSTVDMAIMALKIENIGIPFVAPMFLLAMISLFRPNRLKNWMFVSVVLYSLALAAVVIFNESHQLFYTSVELAKYGETTMVKLGHGVLFYIHQAILFVFVVIMSTFMINLYAKGGKQLRKRLIPLIICIAVAFAADIFNVLSVVPIDLMPIFMTALATVMTMTIRKYNMLDLLSIASGAALDTMYDSIIILENDWTFLFCNDSAERLFPQILDMTFADDVTRLDGWPKELGPQTQPCEVTFSVTQENGDIFTYMARVSAVINEQKKQIGWSIVIRDDTVVTHLMERLEAQAAHDPLTGIYNRRHFMAVFEKELSASSRLAMGLSLIMFDIDYFKDVNDTYGHLVGDKVLRHVTKTIQTQLRTYDMFARYGGEEFVILTIADEEGGLEMLANRLRLSLEKNVFSDGELKIPVTASFGAVLLQPALTTIDDAIVTVDKAMYTAKALGRNKVVFERMTEATGS